MGEITIDSGEVKQLVKRGESREFYIEIEGGDVRLGRTSQEARTTGRAAPRGDRGPLKLASDEALWAYNPSGGTATVRFDNNGFIWRREPRTSQQSPRENRDGVEAETASVGTSASPLPSVAIPDGFDAVVQADPTNTENVKVGPSGGVEFVLRPGGFLTFGVTDTAALSAQAVSGTQTVIVGGEQ